MAGGGDPGRYDDGVEHDLVFISHVQLRPRRGTRRGLDVIEVAGVGCTATAVTCPQQSSKRRRPVVRGTRMRVSDVLSLLAFGADDAEILEDYPYLEADDIKACLAYAAEQADHAVVIAS